MNHAHLIRNFRSLLLSAPLLLPPAAVLARGGETAPEMGFFITSAGPGDGANLESTGGAGLFYCFAAD